MNKITVLIITTLMLVVSGCGERSESSRKMDEAWRLMESAPDSSLMILESMDSIILKKDKDRARYALLKSMALDKNVIDTTTFDVLQPAIDYYPKHGSPDEKLRTYYYQGRIYQNAGRNDEAMRAFVTGLYLRPSVTDTLTIARMLVAQGAILKSVYAFQDCIDNQLEASELFYKKRYYYSYADCLANALNAYYILENKNGVDSIIGLCHEAYANNWMLKEDFLPCQLDYYQLNDSVSVLKGLLAECDSLKYLTPNCILTMANAYVGINEPQKAYSTLCKLDESEIDDNQIRYYGILLSVYEQLGEYKKAFYACMDFLYKLSDFESKAYNQKLQWSNERYLLEIEKQNEKVDKESTSARHTIIGLVLLLIIGFLGFIIYVVRSRKSLVEEKAKSSQLEIEKLNMEKEMLLKEQERVRLENEMLLKDQERARLEKEMLLKEQERARLEKEMLLKEQERARLENEMLLKDQERARLEKEMLLKEQERARLEKEMLLKEQEHARLEREMLEQKVDNLEREQDRLTTLLNHSQLSDEVRLAIKERVEILNSLLASEISSNDKYGKTYETWLEEIKEDRKKFMNTTRLALTASHPEFIRYFEDKGLTIDEINYVCLYAIGMNGKEVGIYMNRPSHVNISSAIRKKLNIDKHETNIGIYVRRLLKDL